ncbi:MAG: hypothetical protein FJ095_12180 [Deltaproteobacteria bacterium]|nr:hypothetical protein [Deltaproteobacteria bacterium]
MVIRVPARLAAAVTYVGSAALAAWALHAAWVEPLFGGVLLVAAGMLAAHRWRVRRRIDRMLRSGDVRGVLARWSTALGTMPHPGTMAPLMTATAFAAYGWTERARAAIDEAARGPAWDAALEHRLFLEAMLSAFEGDLELASQQAERLQRLPVPAAGARLHERIRVLRGAVLALVRAFAHNAAPNDRRLLLQASQASPLVFWAMRYAAAIAAVDQGEIVEARELILNAPSWSEESCFARFHREISDEIARRVA